MSENAVQVVPSPPASPAIKKKPKKPKNVDKAMGISEAEKWMKSSGFKKLDAIKLRARAKVGSFIEQEGEHHIARAILANTFSDLEDYRATCEEKLAKAKEGNNNEEYERWMKLSLIVAEQMNKAAQHLNMTRRRVDPGDEASAFAVPTMPARTVITNNTQILVHPPKAE